MKKQIVLILIFVFLLSYVIAQGKGVNGSEGLNKSENGGIENNSNKSNGFVPWQKRNESECPEGCKCVGAVTSCETEEGKTMTIMAGNSENEIVIEINKVKVKTEMKLEQSSENNKTKLRTKLENGRNVELKIMPDRASERALERLRLKNCVEENGCFIELKEVGEGNGARLSYELKAKRSSRIFGIFRASMNVQSNVDAETGEIISVKKPWWAFLASEPLE